MGNYRILNMSSLLEGGAEECSRVQRFKAKLEMWKVQAVDMVCGKYFHHPIFPSCSSYPSQFLHLLSLSFFPSFLPFLSIPSFSSLFCPSFLLLGCPSIHPSVCLAVGILVQPQTIGPSSLPLFPDV